MSIGIILLLVGFTVAQAVTINMNPILLEKNNTNFNAGYQFSIFEDKKDRTEEIMFTNSDDLIYSLEPDWISDSPHYSTGAALADFNQDNWLDLVVSDGNDMDKGHVRVYLNDGFGHLPTTASWQSADVAYNGHLDVTDINGDGWPDIAVSYLGTSSSFAPIARVYMNNNGVISSNADWSADVTGNAFGLDFGDMNNDGKPDLAIATGWSYDSYNYHTYVYLNINGSYGTTPSWVSDDRNIYMGVLWVDADNDGWLDLAGIGYKCQTQIYRNLDGTLETTASWNTTDSTNQFGIMLTSGDVTGDGVRDLFTTDNTQLGGDGWFKQYTGLSEGFYKTTNSWEYYGGYGSAVALADVNGDSILDLATGAWWDNTHIFLNQETGLPAIPSWNSSYFSVIEKIVFGNIGPFYCEQVFTEEFTTAGDRKLFYLPYHQIQGIDAVICDGYPLKQSEYTYSREEGWVTVHTDPVESLDVVYRYSPSQDMVVTNWDPNTGNYLYYNILINNTGSDLECNGLLVWDDIKLGATVQGNFTVSNIGSPFSYLDWEILSYPNWGTWSFTPPSGMSIPFGDPMTVHVTIIAPNEKNTQFQGDIKIVNKNNGDDSCSIPVTLKTPYTYKYQITPYQRLENFLKQCNCFGSFDSFFINLL